MTERPDLNAQGNPVTPPAIRVPEPGPPPGALHHVDLDPEAAAEMTRRNNQTSPVPVTPRTRAQVGIARKP
jgi:hypothetical protein